MVKKKINADMDYILTHVGSVYLRIFVYLSRIKKDEMIQLFKSRLLRFTY